GGGTRAGDGTGGQPARGAAPPAAALTSLSPTLVGAGPGARFGRARGRGRGSPPAPRPQISGGGRRARRGGRRLPPVLPRAAGPGRRPHGGERRPRRDGKGGRPLHRPPRRHPEPRIAGRRRRSPGRAPPPARPSPNAAGGGRPSGVRLPLPGRVPARVDRGSSGRYSGRW